MRKRNSEKGFTIIELVVVILLLGILTATALPRFMDVTSQAHDAVVQGVLGGMNTGVALARATWFAEGRGTSVTNFGAGGVNVNTSGYVSGVAGGPPASGNDCIQAYSDVLQPGGRPTTLIHNTTGEVVGTTIGVGDEVNLAYTADFEVAHSATTCWFIYTGEGSTVSSPVLTYNTTDGSVVLETTEL